MDFIKGKLKTEAEKLEQKYLGTSHIKSGDLNFSHSGGSGHQGTQLGPQHHLDPRKCHFESRPVGPVRVRDDVTISWSSLTELGDVLSNTTFVKRDLGFAGQIGQHVLLSYGDTMYADANLSCDQFRGMTSNSIAIATNDPLLVVDTNLNEAGYPNQGVMIREDWGENMGDDAVGITNAVETGNGQGVIFTLLNHRPGGNSTIMGAGLATVSLSNDPFPKITTTRTAKYLWDGKMEPWYGDVGSVRSDTHIYAYGHKKDSLFVYLARVPIANVLDVSCYEYWHGEAQGWSKDRLIGEGDLGADASVLWNVNQGQVWWSPHFQRWMFVYCDNFWNSTVILKHAPAPEGPWSQPIDVIKIKPIQEGGTIYAASPHPHFDPSGKTLIVSYTNHPNTVQALKIVFN